MNGLKFGAYAKAMS